jgi:vitamin B12 transport system permease protein
MSIRQLSGALLIAIVFGTAGGAAWMLLTLYQHHRLPWLAWPVGLVLGWTLRGRQGPGRQGTAAAALVAATATLLAACYVDVLVVVVSIAGNMGLGMLATIRTAGAGMLIQLAWSSLSTVEAAWYVSGAAVAAAVAWRAARRP